MSGELVKFGKGTTICGRWKIIGQLGSGGCGAVYKVEDTKRAGFTAALKAEAGNVGVNGVLKLEVQVLKKLESLPHTIRMYDCGRRPEYSFYVMTLCGHDLLNLAHRAGNNLSRHTLCRIGVMCLAAIKQIHDIGFVHRDVKPGNFVAAAPSGMAGRILYLIDFGEIAAGPNSIQAGLIRSHVKKSKAGFEEPRKPRKKVELRGTMRYCSLNTHLRKEQGRVDDCISLMFVLQAIHRGLPWDNCKVEAEIVALKKECSDAIIFVDSPAEFIKIAAYLRTVEGTGRPNYAKIYKLLMAQVIRDCATFLDPYEWETKEPEAQTMIEPVAEETITFRKETDQVLQYRVYPTLAPAVFEEDKKPLQ